ncbi:MAG TPA: hypothetical protein VFS23_02310 [Vicinamibacterales bacterium]|nr:hypothetical protein [Vicinamibacterales bacterium]
MLYFKSALVGFFTAFVAIVIVILAMFRFAYGEGSGSMSVYIGSWQILAAGVIGFAIGFWLTLRRGRVLVRNA